MSKRKASEDIDDRADKRESAVFYFAWRFSLSMKNFPEGTRAQDALVVFQAKTLEELKVAMTAAAGPKGHFIFQLECTAREHDGDCKDPLDNWHYQGYLHVQVKRRAHELGGQLGKQFPGLWISPSSTAGQEACKTYVMKRDSTYRQGPWSEKGIVQVYQGHDLPKVLRPFQAYIKDAITKEVNDRVINWIYNPGGNIGKSKLVKYLCYNNLAGYISFGKASDLINRILAMGAKSAYVLDLPRSKPKDAHMEDIYCVLEGLKNGHVQSTKYEGGELMFNPPHVWVFSNYLPEAKAMSSDRFKIWEVDQKTYDWANAPLNHPAGGPPPGGPESNLAMPHAYQFIEPVDDVIPNQESLAMTIDG